jgi:hypothetical protein
MIQTGRGVIGQKTKFVTLNVKSVFKMAKALAVHDKFHKRHFDLIME